MKGQVTIYVILGIVIVFTIAGIFILKDYVLKSEFEREAEKFRINEEFIPIYNSYVNCIREIANDGASILASQGGYINIPRYEYLVNPLIPFSNKLDVFGNNALEVAYWFYETGNGIKTEKIPSLQEMQNELSAYINNNILSCTKNLTGYEGYNLNDFNSFNSNVQITDNKIFIEVLSDFNVDYKGVNQRFDNVKASLDNSLGYLYSKAVELYYKEKNENYFEEKTIDYMVIYDAIPFSGESLSCTPRVWSKRNIENDLKQIIEINTEFIGRLNNKYYKIDLGDNSLGLSFMYQREWPFFMEIDGGEEILREESAFGENSDAANFLMALFCLNNHHFIYDIKYPLMARLSKNNLDFQFAFEVVIDNNQPKENVLGGDTIPSINNNICEYKNKMINLYAIDYETEKTIGDVIFKFSCVGTSCDIGKTKLDNIKDYSLKELVPRCVNADIKSYKEGYHFGKTIVDTNEESSTYILMKKYHKLKANIAIIDKGVIRRPNKDEAVFISFMNQEDGFSKVVEGYYIDLIAGDYIIRASIMKNIEKSFKITGDEIKNCVDTPKSGILGIIGLKDKRCFTTKLEDVEINQILVGGNEFEWSYDGSGNEITIYVNYDKIPSNINEIGDIYHNILNSNNVRYPEVR